MVFVVFASEGGFGAFVADYAELFWLGLLTSHYVRYTDTFERVKKRIMVKRGNIPGDSTVRQCSSPLSPGYVISLDAAEEWKKLKSPPRGIDALRTAGRVTA
jgi:hypothetical protein